MDPLEAFPLRQRPYGAHPAQLANVRQVIALLRYLHLVGGTLYQEKLPFPGYVLRTAGRKGLVNFTTLDGYMRDREGHTQVSLTEHGHAFLRLRDCLRFGQEDDQSPGRNIYDRDFSAVLLYGQEGFLTIPYVESWE